MAVQKLLSDRQGDKMSRGLLLYLCLLAAVCYAIVFLPEKVIADNEIELTQSGTDFTLTVDQIGGYNFLGGDSSLSFSGSINGTYNEVVVHQHHKQIGSAKNSIIIYDFDGNNNYVEMRQGSDRWNGIGTTPRTDNTEYSGHNMTLDLDGSNNTIVTGQRNPNDIGHSKTIGVYSDNNSVLTTQGNDNYKEMDVYIWNDGNTVEISQHGTQSADAYVDLQGAYGTNFNLVQDNTTSAVNYTVFQNCQTAGGCSITVTQSN